ncbi:hypothetical protein ACUR5C_12950 [Aliikangiella sp. IMCC44653]
MKDKKIASTPKRAPATRKANHTQLAQMEQSLVFNHLMKKSPIDCDLAYEKYGIKHLHSIISSIEKSIPVGRLDIKRPHPKKHYLRPIKRYYIEPDVIKAFLSGKSEREKIKRDQQSKRIAKLRAKLNKNLERMCDYCNQSTMEIKIKEIYRRRAANDD